MSSQREKKSFEYVKYLWQDEVADQLSQVEGYDVALIARSPERLGALTEILTAEGIRTAGFPADVTDRSAVTAALSAAGEKFGRIEV